jgi:hypothetical protein
MKSKSRSAASAFLGCHSRRESAVVLAFAIALPFAEFTGKRPIFPPNSTFPGDYLSIDSLLVLINIDNLVDPREQTRLEGHTLKKTA